MYLSIISAIIGIAFILSGIAGFVPGLYENGLLYGVFYVDTVHNVANFIIGFIAIVVSLKYKADRYFFQIFGILFGISAIAGFVWRGGWYFTHVNMADTIMHLVLAVFFLILGFSATKEGRV